MADFDEVYALNSISCKEKTTEKAKDRERFFVRYGINRFPDRLKEAMKAAGIPSNNQLAKDTELSEATIRKYLKGETYPTLDRLALLADAFACSMSWLASGEGSLSGRHEHIDEDMLHIHEPQRSEIDNILSYLTIEQKVKFFKVIYTKGVAAILSLDEDFDSRLMALTDEEKERLLALHEAKKGAPVASENNTLTDSTLPKASSA